MLYVKRVAAGFAPLIGMLYLFLSYWELSYADLGFHLACGQLIWETESIPSTVPLLPLSEGVRFIDTAWLSQLLGYGFYSWLGTSALHLLYAGGVSLSIAVLARCMYRRTGSIVYVLLGLGVFAGLGWWSLQSLGPAIAGLNCYVVLFAMLTARGWSRAYWGIIPAVFVLWANLHASFALGLILMGIIVLGRAIDVGLRSRRPLALLQDRTLKRWFLLMQISAVATLLNPYGLELYAGVFRYVSHANLNDLESWQPLNLRMLKGQIAALVVAVLLILSKFISRRNNPATEVLMLVVLGGMTFWTACAALWWAVPAAYYVAIYSHSAVTKVSSQANAAASVVGSAPRHGSGALLKVDKENGFWTVVTLSIVWLCWACSPVGARFLRSESSDHVNDLSTDLSTELVRYLNSSREEISNGLLFNSVNLGGPLLFGGASGLPMVVSSPVHLIPNDIWKDYLKVVGAESGWEEIVSRLGANAIVLDGRSAKKVVRLLRRNKQWRIGHEDDRVVLFLRKEPIWIFPDE